MELFAKIDEICVKHLRWRFFRKYLTDGISVKHLIGAFHESVNLFREKFHLRWLTRFRMCLCISLCEKCPNTELFLVRIFLYADWIRTRNNSVFGHFSRNEFHGLTELLMRLNYSVWNSNVQVSTFLSSC